MNDNVSEKSWAYWLMICIERLRPYLFMSFLIWCGCKYDVSVGVWVMLVTLGILSFG